MTNLHNITKRLSNSVTTLTSLLICSLLLSACQQKLIETNDGYKNTGTYFIETGELAAPAGAFTWIKGNSSDLNNENEFTKSFFPAAEFALFDNNRGRLKSTLGTQFEISYQATNRKNFNLTHICHQSGAVGSLNSYDLTMNVTGETISAQAILWNGHCPGVSTQETQCIILKSQSETLYFETTKNACKAFEDGKVNLLTFNNLLK